MQTARQQALNYVRALPADEPRPLFILVVDVGHCIDIYSNFAGVGESFIPFPDQSHFRLSLAALAEESNRQLLRQIFLDPQQLDPTRRAARVTRELAGYLAGVSAQLERAGYAPDLVAHFLMRCLFTMFAEDVGLIPKASFTGLLRQYATPDLRQHLPDALQNLWQKMDTGGFSSELKARVPRFNGKLFHEATALPLTADQIELLLKAAEADWTEVEPAIFGTLLERALDPKERHRLGAHYTPRRYVERLILPTVLEPLRREWAAAQAASARRLEEEKPKDARAELVRFHRRLTSLRILDPACGSGNFLYVTLEHLKRLEGEVLTAINSYGHTTLLDLGQGTTVGPHQFLGLELNPRAATVADVVLRIGYLQWHSRTYGLSELREPLLNEYQNIRQQDAILQHDAPILRLDATGQPVTRWDGTTRLHPTTGQSVPDETARTLVLDYPNPRPAEWPEADFIVGNPPFIGDKAMRRALGDGYVDALRKAYRGEVPESADFVMYWWNKAASTLQKGVTHRFGFITTNSITMKFNRRVMQRYLDDIKQPVSIQFAIPDHPWVDGKDGADVRVAFTVAERGTHAGEFAQVISEKATTRDEAHEVELLESTGRINADLTVGADVASSQALQSNAEVSSMGVMLIGAGFILSPEKATELGLGSNELLSAHMRPYRNGKDLMARARGVYVIDLFGLGQNEVLSKLPAVYQHVLNTVKPERDQNTRASRRENWWLFGETNPRLRKMVSGLSRYIATPETAKHRVFQFLDPTILPDNKLVITASDDAYHLGVLSSRHHVVWAMTAGGNLGVGNDSVYNKTRCFDPFPFPATTLAQQARIRELAEQLDAHRKRQQAQHPTLTLTDLYNVVEKLRAAQLLTAKDQMVNQQGLASVVLSLHQHLDAAVADAYGWPANLPEADILTRLVRLNHERAREEQAGHVRYLRPAYQAPHLAQATLALPTMAATDKIITPGDRHPWPIELAAQMQAVWSKVQQAGYPVDAVYIAQAFQRTRPEKVQPLLATLSALALVRQTTEGGYVA